MLPSIEQRLAIELAAQTHQIAAAVSLMDDGATVPFIARYRKEATGGLDDTQLRSLELRLMYLRELEDRRKVVVNAITELGKMTPALFDEIMDAEDKTRLEDLYLPYKVKRRTRAQLAIEAGLLPLAEGLLADPTIVPEEAAEAYLKPAFKTDVGDNPGIPDVKAALDGARCILIERFAEDADLLKQCRSYLAAHGVLESKVNEGKEEEGEKYADYFAYSEFIEAIPPHRALALLRGRRADVLALELRLDTEEEKPNWGDPLNPCEQFIAQAFNIVDQGRAADRWLIDTARWCWRVKIFLHLETELMSQLRERGELGAIDIFARNLKDLLLAAPAGAHTTMGLDPGLRTGVKVAVVDPTGKVLDHTTVYPHAPRDDWNGALQTLAQLAKVHSVALISIGNGTASRETDKLAQELIQQNPELNLKKVMVSEAGASVYSASEYAAKELPELDVTIRGAVSIARRLQDPLAELVKIDPKSIGVGQYQHDVCHGQLTKTLESVVEDCVNAVGVDVNTASIPLLAKVSGLSTRMARSIIDMRETEGPFKSRDALRKVARMGTKTFEQAAGFLRVNNGKSPLDASSVHPEAYPVVERIVEDLNCDVKSLIGDVHLLRSLDPAKYADERFGIPTVSDILKELEKPGRDPRPEFSTAVFKEGINTISDLQNDMVLEGVVTNVAAFGAFVDIGVHQDGLVHISALSEAFVSDPHAVVRVGQIVKVKVLEVDEKRKRIALTMRLTDSAAEVTVPKELGRIVTKPKKKSGQAVVKTNTAMAAAFAKVRD